MPSYPLCLRVKEYSGKDEKKKLKLRFDRELAKKIEDHVNSNIQPGESKTFNNYEIANAVSANKEDVARLIYATDASSNGITVSRPAERT